MPDIANFLTNVKKARDEICRVDEPCWYRGVGDCNYRLYPSLLRPRSGDIRHREAEIFREYLNLRGTPEHNNSWDHLVHMQHHGTPTRLLDWTETLFVAAYFAVIDWRKKTEADKPRAPAIYLLNPQSLLSRAKTRKRFSLFSTSVAELPQYDMCFVERKRSWPYAYPIPFRARRASDRMRAQRGFFTIHGNDHKPLDDLTTDVSRQVRIPKDVIASVFEYLEHAGIDEIAMFPDSQGFAKYVARKYFGS